MIRHRPTAWLAASLLCLACWAGAGMKAAEAASVRVHRVAAVRQGDIHLKDIAERLPGLEEGRWAAMASKKIAAAPSSPGRRMRIGRDRLKSLLGRVFGRAVEGFQLPDQLVVQRGGLVIREQELHRRVLSFLRDKTQGMPGDAELRDVRIPEHIFLEHRRSSIQCQAATSIKPGRNSLWIKAIGPGGKLEKRFSGNVFIDLWRSVPCAARPLNRHDQISPEAISFERKNLAYLSYEIWDGQGGPWRLTRSVGTGQVLYTRHLEPVPVIGRGDQVSLCFESEYIRLRVPALAMEDAGYGETLRVRNLQSKKTVYAKVEDKDTVVVK